MTMMNYRYDLLQWQKERTGVSYGQLAERTSLGRQLLCDTVRGETSRGPTNPTVTTIRETFEALGLDPKYALDKKLKRSQFRRAVVGAAR